MMRFSFKKGLVFLQGERTLTIIRRLMGGDLQLEADDGELINCSEAEILEGCTKGVWIVDQNSAQLPLSVKVSRDLTTFPQKVQEKALLRQQYLDRLTDNGRLVCNLAELKVRIQNVAIEIGDVNPPSAITIYRWYRRKMVSGSILALTDKYELRGRRVAWSEEVNNVVQNAIDTIYLNRQLYPKLAVYEDIERNLFRLQKQFPEKINHLKTPSRSSIYKYLKKYEAYEVTAARLGKRAADKQFRSVIGKQKTTRLLERVEIDHTPLNLLVICDKTLLPLGKPWLTAALDKHSRMIVGYYISFREPSAYADLQCLKQSILPKDDLLKDYEDISTPWPARGFPEVIVCDNGRDLHANALRKLCLELGIQIQFCPAKKPEYKGAVERFLKTINHDLIHKLPGTVFSSPDERGDYSSEQLACITFATLQHLILKWIVEIYAQSPHRGLSGVMPLQKWNIGEREQVLEYPAEPSLLEVIVGHTGNRAVFHYGVEINGLLYNDHELQILRRKVGENLRVDLKYYEDNLSYIHVFDIENKYYIKVEAIDQEYTHNLRLVQHKAIRKALRAQMKDPGRRELLLQKKQELQDIVTQSIHKKKMAKRKRGAVFQGRDNTAAKSINVNQYDSVTDKDTDEIEMELPTFGVDWREDIKNQQGGRES
jgi:putative transposase